MKLTIKMLVTLLAIGAMTSATALRAQEDKPAPPAEGARPHGPARNRPSPAQQIERLDKAVTLTAEQKTKLLDIYTKAAEQAKALTPEERRAKGPEIMKATRDQVRALLTPEQQAKFDAMPMGPRGGDHKPKNDK